MTCEIENPFICLFINHNLLVQFVRFFIGSFFIGSRCFLNVLYIIVCFAHCKYLLSMCGLPFSLFFSILIVKKVYMNIIQFVYVLYFLLNRSALPKDYKDILLYFILKFLRLCFWNLGFLVQLKFIGFTACSQNLAFSVFLLQQFFLHYFMMLSFYYVEFPYILGYVPELSMQFNPVQYFECISKLKTISQIKF